MKLLKVVGVVAAIYIVFVALFEGVFLGYNQPKLEGFGIPMLVLTTTDASGEPSPRRLARIETDGKLYVSAHHWPRGWYHEAVANPDVQVEIDGITEDYVAVPVEGEEFQQVAARLPLGFRTRFLMGFPPERDVLRLDRAGASTAQNRPNIVLIMADDLGYADLGFQGVEDIPTPSIDALAASGVRFTSGYVSGTWCSPTRAGLMTGRYQQRFGEAGHEPTSDNALSLQETTLADRLQAAGYATGLIGKWHLGTTEEFHPMKRGFDEFFGFLRGGHSFLPDIPIIIFPDKNGEGVDFGATEQGRSRLDGQILRGYDVVREENYLTDAFGREAVSFIKRHEAEPFFLYLSFNAVHTPMHADDLRFEKFSNIEDPVRRIYNAMTLAMDDAVGEVMAQLRRSNLEEKTLVFFISDNGGPTVLRYAYNASSNAPLRGSKGTALEGGIRVPFVASWPGVLSAGVNHDEAVIQLDIMPTILAAAGLDIPSELDGINLLPQLRGERSDRPKGALFWKSFDQMAVRQGDWKLVTYPEMINHGELPRGFDQDAGPLTLPQLYNLRTDIGERNDLAAAEPERVAELQALWNEWNAEIGQSNQRTDPQ